jgi:Uma2 family endonuclease
MAMKAIQLQKKLSDEEYFLFEEKNEIRHEMIDGNLYPMGGISIFHNDIVRNMLFLFGNLLKGTSWKIVFESFKIRTPERNYFYPDIAVCHPQVEKYFSEQPILLVEVLSDTTRKYNLTDKFIQYQKIATLQYYLCIEPEQQVVLFYYKQEDGEWMAETLTSDEQTILLPALNISFSLKDIYNP